MDIHYQETAVTDTATTLLAQLTPHATAATVVGLTGELGAGKTTLVKAAAGLLGITEPVVSPTFVIAKYYHAADSRWQHLVHIDAYRIEDTAELDALGWGELLMQPQTLVIVEWPERIKAALPASTQHFILAHLDNARRITRI